MNGFMTTQEASKKWKISTRQVQILCKKGKISGVSRVGRNWIIPEDAQKPTYTYVHVGVNSDDANSSKRGE